MALKSLKLAVTIVGVVIIGINSVYAATVHVPTNYSFNDAYNLCNSGDVIILDTYAFVQGFTWTKSGITVVGNNNFLIYANATYITMQSCGYNTFNNVFFYMGYPNAGTITCMELIGGDHINFNDCYFSTIQTGFKVGVWLYNNSPLYQNKNINFLRCTFNSNTYGIFSVGQTKNLSIQNGYSCDQYRGFDLGVEVGYTYYSRVSGNTFEMPGGPDVYAIDARCNYNGRTIFESNMFTITNGPEAYPIHFYNSSSNNRSTIAGNYFFSCPNSQNQAWIKTGNGNVTINQYANEFPGNNCIEGPNP